MPYYNDFDARSCAWLRELQRERLIPWGVVDGRSIADLRGADCAPFKQCHFFAGIGGWPLAMQLAGVPRELNIWSGSCPCQPFSVAGAGRGVDDPRHLWPEFHRLIGECRPAVVVGEQVASRAGRGWLAGVRADLETLGYAVGAADLCAPGVGAPHIRQRLYWVAYRDGQGWSERGRAERLAELPPGHATNGCGAFGRLPDTRRTGIQLGHLGHAEAISAHAEGESQGLQRQRRKPDVGHSGATHGLPDTDASRRERGTCGRLQREQPDTDGAWDNYELCYDSAGKARRIEPGLEPLVDGLPGRVGLLRGYGNAIVPQLAAAFLVAAGLGR